MHGHRGMLVLWFSNDFDWCVWSSIWSSLSLVWPTENHARAHVWSSIRSGHCLVWPTTNRTALDMCNRTGQKKRERTMAHQLLLWPSEYFMIFSWYFQIFSDYPGLLHPTAHCRQILDRCTSLVHTLVTFLSSYTLCDWSIFLKPVLIASVQPVGLTASLLEDHCQIIA